MAEKMSDADIRSELIALGEKSIGPITDTTRPLYIKKLTRLKADKTKAKSADSRGRTVKKPPFVGFSSDESEDEQATQPGPTGRKALNKSRSLRSNTSKNISSVTNGSNFRSVPRSSPQAKSKITTTKHTSNVSINSRRGRLSTNNTRNDTTLDDDKTYSHLWDDDPSMRSAFMQTSFNSTHNRTYDLDDGPRLGIRDHGNEFSDSDREETDKSPWMVSHSVKPSSSVNINNEWKPRSQSSFQNSNLRNRPLNSKLRSSFSDQTGIMGIDGYKASGNAQFKCSQYISMFLLMLAVIFFGFLAFVYVSMQRAEHNLEKESLNLLICESGNSKEGCYEKEAVTKAVKLVQELSSKLMDQAGRYECGYESQRSLSFRAVEDHLKEAFGTDCGKGKMFAYDILIALELFQKNPSWKVKLYDGTGAVTEDKAAVTSMEAEEPRMSFLCRLQRSMERMFRSIVIFSLVTICILVLVLYVRYKWRKEKQEQQQIFNMVEQIINLLKDHHDACQTDRDLVPYIAIPHIRDQLIPIKERKKYQRVWEKAVKFLSENESRVREETQKIQGEEFLVWRWIQASANGGKVWQGPAFERESPELAANMPSFTPLPCLKIRNMFDIDSEYERDWHVKIQDAILEKCGPAHGLVHIAVDKKSNEGCVYVKCDSKEAAGRAFHALHGSWFNSRLVTVKFLRVERYRERFPEAAHCTRQLKPSDDLKSSLSQPYHKSFLEQY